MQYNSRFVKLLPKFKQIKNNSHVETLQAKRLLRKLSPTCFIKHIFQTLKKINLQ